MKLQESVGRLRDGLFRPRVWERDPEFRHELDTFVRRGLLASGGLAIVAVVIYLFVNLVLLGKQPLLRLPESTGSGTTVVLWDKLLVAVLGGALVLLYHRRVGAATGRWVCMAIVALVSAASVVDDVVGGVVSFTPVYPTLFMLVAVGTVMLRPMQTLGMSLVVTAIVFGGEAFISLPGRAAPGIVPEQIPFMFIVSVVLTEISLLIYLTRHQQYLARTRAEALEKEIAAYAHELERKAGDLELAKSRAEEHAKALEEEQKITKRQARRLAEAERLKDRFFANVSHEFRTPLTLILGPVEDALGGEYGTIPAQFERQLSVIKSSAQRLLHLVNDLLDLSKLDAGAVRLKPKTLEVVEFLTPVVQTFGDLARRKDVKLTFETSAPSVRASFDPDAIEKVVYNLVSNALKFTPQGGSVRIRLYTEHAHEELVCIAVRDTGPGIEEGEIGRIFDRFHQAKASAPFEGTGLGLSLVRELIELHGGSVVVDSEPGFGSEFTIKWPTGHRVSAPTQSVSAVGEIYDSNEPVVDAESTATESVRAPAHAPLVLVVDNDPDVRAYIRSRLEETYRVAEAENGLEALDCVAEQRPSLVICDVMMPVMDGIEFCKRLRKSPETADIPVVLLTARADDESRVEGLQAGADDYMSKPFSSVELLARAENLIEIRRIVRARTTAGIVEPTEIDVPSIDQTFLDSVKATVENHIANSNFGVEWLADEMSLSSRQLQRKMKSLTGLSAAGYIRLMRLKRALQLLQKRAGNVSEVASDVGFRDAAHFSRLFRQTFGILPSEVPEMSSDGDPGDSGAKDLA